MHRLFSILPILLYFLAGCYSPSNHSLPSEVDFNYHIKPILSDRCFACHGPDDKARKADLRLDIEEEALAAMSESGRRMIQPGNLSDSELYHRISSDDPEYIMPPPESNLFLSDEEKALLSQWIEQGAEYKPHWSFISPERPDLPAGNGHPVDMLVEKELKKYHLSFSREADKRLLIRRVAFNLTGLPPSEEEIRHFLADESPDAYEQMVDHFLGSSAYGERMASFWLDIARYADSHGYQTDGFRFVWPWRDWVIQAFNENQPFDQFITWQLAGDLLPQATQQQKLATTFLRNHRINSEFGIVDEEYRVEYVADRTNTFGTAFLGLTVECARCHDHKYDPLTQQEYYQLFAFFNQVNEKGLIANDGNPGPLLPLSEAEVEERVRYLKTHLKQEEESLQKIVRDISPSPPPTATEISNLLTEGLIIHLPLESQQNGKTPNLANLANPASLRGNPEKIEGVKGSGLRSWEYDGIATGKETVFERSDPFSVSLWVNPAEKDEFVPVWGHPTTKNKDYRALEMAMKQGIPSVRLSHAIPHNFLEVQAEEVEIPVEAWSHITVTWDGSGKASGVRMFVDGKKVRLRTVQDHLYKNIAQKNLGLRFGGKDERGGFQGGMIDEIRVYNRRISDLEAIAIYHLDQPGGSIQIQETPENLKDFALLHLTPQFSIRQEKADSIRRQLFSTIDTVREIMTIEESPGLRTTFILERGVYDAPGAEVSPATPAILPAIATSEQKQPNRLHLAEWLTSREHPLTARVMVNRIWQMHFGRGLVNSPADFGNQGDLPSHPALMDLLAVAFMESGWDIKKLHRMILTSKTFRQTSETDSALMARDPDNILLARGPSFRLPAEMIRDQALAASDLLVMKTGGPPVKPYQPPGLWKELAPLKNSLSEYRQDHGEKLYRRSLYTIWKRSSPPPALGTFDAPSRNNCIVRRQNTNTPLQSLVLWNDPQFVEAARVLGENMVGEGRGNPDIQIAYAFRQLTGLEPIQPELTRLRAYYDMQLAQFSQNPEEACALISTGEYPQNSGFEPAEIAAAQMTASVIMNYDKAIILR